MGVAAAPGAAAAGARFEVGASAAALSGSAPGSDVPAALAAVFAGAKLGAAAAAGSAVGMPGCSGAAALGPGWADALGLAAGPGLGLLGSMAGAAGAAVAGGGAERNSASSAAGSGGGFGGGRGGPSGCCGPEFPAGGVGLGLVFRAWPCANAARLVLSALAYPDKPPSAAATSRAHTAENRCTVWLRCLSVAWAILLVLARHAKAAPAHTAAAGSALAVFICMQ